MSSIQLSMEHTVLLQSAHKYGKNDKYVIVTSSSATLLDPMNQSPRVYTVEDQNCKGYEAISQWKKGDPVDGSLAYCASKVAAERVLWTFQKKFSPKFTINTISPNDITGSPSMVTVYYSGQETDATTANVFDNNVNVEDVALAHIVCY
ncbi:hypothetical protein BGW37DRAFT_470941 [Umbelopsis sp. PMI_123]|nr:hypothetical protein BGW37DRAFT_470941 [Umbelopsis sp. PMI_123]